MDEENKGDTNEATTMDWSSPDNIVALNSEVVENTAFLSTHMDSLNTSATRNPATDGHFDLGDDQDVTVNSPYVIQEQDGIGNDENDDVGGLFGNETLNVENGNTLVEEETDEPGFERSAWGRNTIQRVEKQIDVKTEGGDEDYNNGGGYGEYNQEVSWVAYLDPSSGQPYYVDEISGYKTWVQPEDGNFVWGEVSDDIIDRHFTTGVKERHENLGPDYRETPWVIPDFKKGEQARREALFEQGKAPICGITSRRLGKLGVGIRLYFEFSNIFGMLLFFGFIFSIPAIVLYSSGKGIHFSEHDDVLELATLTPGMFTPSYDYMENVTAKYNLEQNDTSKLAGTMTLEQFQMVTLKDQTVYFGSIKMTRSNAASMVSWIDAFISLILLASYPLLRMYMKNVDDETGLQTTTTADYSVEVHGKMPQGTTEEDLIEHFSNLYKLDEEDFRNRPVFNANDKNHCSAQRKGAVKPVQNITHVAGEPDGGEKYLGKWVAEVAIHYNNGDTLMKYLELSGIQKQIKHWRGIAKKFSDDTPYSKGPNPRMVEKAENKLVQLEFLEEERMKSIHEKNDVIGAFVVFNHEESYLRCVEDHQLQKNQRTCHCCTCCHINLSICFPSG